MIDEKNAVTITWENPEEQGVEHRKRRRAAYRRKRAVGIPPRKTKKTQSTITVRVSEKWHRAIAYTAGKEGCTYSDVLDTILSAYAARAPYSARNAAEAEFAGVCARLKAAMDDKDPDRAASAAAEAVLYWVEYPTDDEIAIAEQAAELATIIAAPGWGQNQPTEEAPQEEGSKIST